METNLYLTTMITWHKLILYNGSMLRTHGSKMVTHLLFLDPPTSLSAVHTTSTTITVYWSPPTPNPDIGYEITYFAGAGDTTGSVVTVGGGNTSSHEINSLNSTVTYHVSIVSVNGTSRSDPKGPVLAARGEYIHSLHNCHVCVNILYMQ